MRQEHVGVISHELAVWHLLQATNETAYEKPMRNNEKQTMCLTKDGLQ